MKKSVLFVVLGLALALAGLVLLRTASDPRGFLIALPYVLIGLGCGVFGQGAGELVHRRALKNAPEAERRERIARADERNAAISNRAKAKAFDVMVYVFGALMVALALMGTEMVVVLLLVFCYLFVEGSGIYYRFKYEKEM